MAIIMTRLSSRALKRSYCTYKNALTSQLIRSRFLDYFVKEKNHKFIKSIPVASHFDSTIPFINAGMCQFKRVFTGEEEIDCDKAANTQKCIRIGGKHNDLNLVGVDSSHHTFFEMLGNWSFGAYGKKEACSMAWQLLTSAPYNISPNRLFVTYFGGDKNLNLPADDEVREIWLELGIPPDRILPFGVKENFWEMGHTGPCGTCTEIHVALDDSVCSRSDLVNKNNPLLAELWNIVFIKFNKTENSLDKLPKEFIDTGMGFERLVSLLQRKTSNYDTDLFVPLLHTISKMSQAPPYTGSFNSDNLDSSYRCLADFSRMITIAISDNIFPDLNPKLKRVLRKTLYLAKHKFNCREPYVLINELSNQVAELYQDIFPEIGNNLQKVKLTVQSEEKVVDNMTNENFQKWNHLVKKYPVLESFSFIEYPGLVHAFNFMLNETETIAKGDYIPAELVHYLYDTYGLDQPVVQKLIDKLEFKVDWDDVENHKDQVKGASRQLSLDPLNVFSILQKEGIKTDDSPMHEFTRSNCGTYNFPDIKVNLVAIVKDNEIRSISKLTDELASSYLAEVELDDGEFGLVFDRSNFFGGETGNCCDKGEVIISAGNESVPCKVVKVMKKKDVLVHFIEPCSKENKIVLKTGVDAVLKLDSANRLAYMRSYTAAHLLLKVLEDLYPLVYYRYNIVMPDTVKVISRALGRKFNFVEDKQFIEERMAKYIAEGVSVVRSTIRNGRDAFSLPHLRISPGLNYPPFDLKCVNFVDNDGKIVTSDFCSGVHLSNVKDLEKFEIVNIKSNSSSDLTISFRVADKIGYLSDQDQLLINDSKVFVERSKALLSNEGVTIGQIIDFNDELSIYLYKVMNEIKNKKFPLSDQSRNSCKVLKTLQQDLGKTVQKFPRDSFIRYLIPRMQKMEAEQKFVVYFCLIDCRWFSHQSFKVDAIYRNQFPTMMIHYSISKRMLSGVAYVPSSFVTENFNADVWLKKICDTFDCELIEEEDMVNYCFMKKKVKEHYIHEYIKPLLSTSADFVAKFVK